MPFTPSIWDLACGSDRGGGSENQNRGERRTRTQEPFGLRDVSWQCLYRFARGTQSTFQRLQQRPALGPFYFWEEGAKYRRERPYSSISRSFCCSSAISAPRRRMATSSETASLASARYFKIFISSSTRSFL